MKKFAKLPKLPKEISDVLFDLGIELLKTLKDLNSKQIKKLKPKGKRNDTVSSYNKRNNQKTGDGDGQTVDN
jgi:hypothetical protein